MFARIHQWRRRLERDPKAKALRTTDDCDHQETHQLSEAARRAVAKAKRLEEHKHPHAAHAEAVKSGAVVALSALLGRGGVRDRHFDQCVRECRRSP
jgi:hypothetical protein